MSDKRESVCRFISRQLKYHRQRQQQENRALPACSPLVVALNGPQGSGKTTLSRAVCQALQGPSFNLKAVAVSLDDFYLTHTEQQQRYLASGELTERLSSHCTGSAGSTLNPLLEYRGNPGTHDIDLGRSTLSQLIRINQTHRPVMVPRYDKAQHGGRGDRCPSDQWMQVNGPVDVVLFEGWMLGFRPLSTQQLTDIHQAAQRGSALSEYRHVGKYTLGQLLTINGYLAGIEQSWYPLLDCLVALTTTHIDQVYTWRLEQEHSLAQSLIPEEGAAVPKPRVLSDDQVQDFVDRFMPAYELYRPAFLASGLFPPPSQPADPCRNLFLTLNECREVIHRREF
ncbi:hypothetical protein H4R33_004138 [Dimargaris cristalligena]|uniref:P-loop containing nucleoside triphosphate hydrolase protein n=1 Tax=Dimargaris cristalligena TaxID=215637 RepID=A0A4P9ZSP3_9FUNG|nr:hypothetical protein H4R33_004138 [Dimargaris cristalligena]RKP35732.1 P-loop containing nucleoside triphosphate hydrolase protein [Dimargaris cristalligena]|eukprot:RKP35732.1 P-loop containing nucleoside triphosphate hydrolase protein [Dimargaris cristalligena]